MASKQNHPSGSVPSNGAVISALSFFPAPCSLPLPYEHPMLLPQL